MATLRFHQPQRERVARRRPCSVAPECWQVLRWKFLHNVPHSALALTLALMLANARGGFLYLAIHVVLGEIFKHHKALVLGNSAAALARLPR
jgi:hypothetical protein